MLSGQIQRTKILQGRKIPQIWIPCAGWRLPRAISSVAGPVPQRQIAVTGGVAGEGSDAERRVVVALSCERLATVATGNRDVV